MSDLFFLFYLICFLPGIASTFLTYVVYIKNKNKLLLFYLIIIICISISLFLSIVSLYFSINHKNDVYFFTILIFIRTFTVSIFIYFIPKFFEIFLEISVNKIKKNILFIYSLCPTIILIIIHVTNILRNHEDYQILYFYFINIVPSFFYILIVYFLIQLYINRKKINNISKKLFLKGFIIIGIITIPFVAFQYYGRMIHLLKIPTYISFEWIHYFLWNIFFIYYLLKIYLFHHPDNENNFNSFCSNFKITPREKDIVKYIEIGLLNKEIAGKLAITEGTVKIHIYNIFQKTGVTSRIDLINLIKSN